MKCVAQPYKMEVLKDWVGLDVGGMEVCDIPIGEDETGGSLVLVFYRRWLYGRKMTENFDQNLVKKSKNGQNILNI